MKNKLLSLAMVLLGCYAANAQVGIGTTTPNPSAQLDVTVENQQDKKGVLIPRVALQDITVMDPIVNNGALPNGLLVFNTATVGTDVVPGYYYWYDNRWYRIVNSQNVNTSANVIYDGTDFQFIDATGNLVTIDIQSMIQDLETLTTLEYDDVAHTLTYTDENGDPTTIPLIDVVGDAQTLTTLEYDDVANTLTYTDENGDLTTIPLIDLVGDAQTVTTLVNNGDGTYTYTSEDTTVTVVDIPAAVADEFQTIINNPAVQNILNQYISQNAEGNVTYNGTDFQFVDATGTLQTIDIQGMIQANETLTPLVDNMDGTYTYTDEDGTQTIIDVPAAVADEFQTIINNPAVQNILNQYISQNAEGNVTYNGTDFQFVDDTGTLQTIDIQSIVQANETLTELNYDAATNELTYIDENGDPTTIPLVDMVGGAQTITTLADNGDGTYTYTSEDNTQTIIDVPAAVADEFQTIINDPNVQNILNTYISNNAEGNVTYNGTDFQFVDATGTLQTIDIQGMIQANETLTPLVDNMDGTYTYTDEDGTQTTIDASETVTSIANVIAANGHRIGTYTSEDNTAYDIRETITTFGQNQNNGVITYTDEEGTAWPVKIRSTDADNILTIDDGGVFLSAAAVNASETNTTLAFDDTTSMLTYTNEDSDNPAIDLSPLAVEPWFVQSTTDKATANTDDIYTLGRVAIGTDANFSAGDRLSVNGTIRTATNVYADYVFEDYFDGVSKINPEYSFKSLPDVEHYINNHKHLPGITPITELPRTETGDYSFNLSELSVQMLEKVEELYLHTIEQEKKIQLLQEQGEQLQKRIEQLEKLLSK